MGLTSRSVGRHALDTGLTIDRTSKTDRVVALAGNPNVGKSTVFNGLTGLHQHTGNWPGKTVTGATGYTKSPKNRYLLVDIPGTYSLMAHSPEEEVARNFLCFGGADAVVVVCDATCLERNLNLALQTMEISGRVIVCLNLMDEARRKGICPDIPLLERRLGVPVVGTDATDKRSLRALLARMDEAFEHEAGAPLRIRYPDTVEAAVGLVEPVLSRLTGGRPDCRFLALRLLFPDAELGREAGRCLGEGVTADPELSRALGDARGLLAAASIDRDAYEDLLAGTLVRRAEEICRGAVTYRKEAYLERDRRIDRLLTGRVTAFPLMLLLLCFLFYLSIVGANYPSALLSQALFWLEDRLSEAFFALGAPAALHGILVLGVYRTLAWVVAVMLPPMAIFFPLFTLLEDAGYLPRVAYNLDRPFCRCRACGKQALTMCMGFGCNAAGVVGCRIIDSPRERLLAILTNAFVPCNGRFPTLIALITMFFVGTAGGAGGSILAALCLTGVILLGVLTTFLVTRILSATLLRGMPSSFTLELPPYRRPRVVRVLVRSLFDRTLFVLGRAAAVAAPAGAVIWLAANLTVGEVSLLHHAAAFLDPFAALLGLDGVILVAFILGFPANEIVVPIIIMAYMAEGSITELGSLAEMRALFIANGWTAATAVSMILFSLFHWPCSTTLLTVHKESGSLKWTALAALIPTLVGIFACMLFTAAVKCLGI